MPLSEIYPHLHGRVVQLFNSQQPDHARALYCSGTQEEHATCHCGLMYLSPPLCGRLTPTQKPVFSLSTRAQVAGGGKVELQQRLPQSKSSRSQGEDVLSVTHVHIHILQCCGHAVNTVNYDINLII